MSTVPNDEEIREFLREYGHILPDPRNYPESLKYYWKIFQYHKEKGKLKNE